MIFTYARFANPGYEVSTRGDTRFSALVARLADGRTIEEAYQLDVKGYRQFGNDWHIGKGQPPLRNVDLWLEYLALWRRWADENPMLMASLRGRATPFNGVLTDMFAKLGSISQARALAQILNDSVELT